MYQPIFDSLTRHPGTLGTLAGVCTAILLVQVYVSGAQSVRSDQSVLADGQATTITRPLPTNSGDLIMEEATVIRIGTPTDRDDLVVRIRINCQLPVCVIPAQAGQVIQGGSIDSQHPGTITTLSRGTGYLLMAGTIDQNQSIEEEK